jgi:hypothetical protein
VEERARECVHSLFMPSATPKGEVDDEQPHKGMIFVVLQMIFAPATDERLRAGSSCAQLIVHKNAADSARPMTSHNIAVDEGQSVPGCPPMHSSSQKGRRRDGFLGIVRIASRVAVSTMHPLS